MDSNFENCVGFVKNQKDIEQTRDNFAMALERVEEKLDDLKNDVSSGFSNVDNRLEKLEKRLDGFEDSLPKKIDERIENNSKTRTFALVKWIVGVLGGSVCIAVVTNFVLKALHIS